MPLEVPTPTGCVFHEQVFEFAMESYFPPKSDDSLPNRFYDRWKPVATKVRSMLVQNRGFSFAFRKQLEDAMNIGAAASAS